MAIGTIDEVSAAPSTMKAPGTWGELQAFNSIIPSQFYAQRTAALSDPEAGGAFAAIDSTLARAVWSRRDTDNADEPLPPDLRKAATELLDLMHIRKPEGALDRAKELGGRVAANVGSLITAVRARLGMKQAATH